MKKISFIMAATAFMVISFSSQAQVSFGLRAGAGLFNIDAKDEDGEKMEEFKLSTGFHAGVFAEFYISPEFAIQPSLLFSTKGSKGKTDFSKSEQDFTFTLSYFELPINLMFKAQLNSGSIFVGAGPYFAYGLKAKMKIGEETIEIPFSNTWQQIDEDREGAIKPLDYGLNVMAGYEFGNGLTLSLNAQMGLANLYVEDPNFTIANDKSSSKNIGFNLSLGYKF